MESIICVLDSYAIHIFIEVLSGSCATLKGIVGCTEVCARSTSGNGPTFCSDIFSRDSYASENEMPTICV